MRSTVVFAVILVVLILAIVGGVVIYAPKPNPNTATNNVTPTTNEDITSPASTPNQGLENHNNSDALKETPIANDSTIGSRVDPIARAHQAANSQNPITKERTYAGYIFDAKNSEPLVGVSVEINESVVAQSRIGDGFFETKLSGQAVPIKATLTYPGYNSLQVSLDVNYEKNIFILIPEGGLFVEVIDNANKPVLYARIMLKSNKGFWSKNVTADIRGRFFELNPPDSPLTISAEYEGFEDKGQATKIVEPPFGEKVTLQLYRPYFSISGRVVERDTQKAISDVLVNAIEPNFVRNEVSQTNQDGYYQLASLHPGSYEISLQGEKDLFMPPEQSKRIVRVIDKSASNVDFELVRGYSVSGVVVDSNQTPVEGATVYLTPYPSRSENYLTMEQSIVTTDQQGEFVLNNLPPSYNDESRIGAVHKELGGGISEPFDPGQENIRPVTIILGGLSEVDGIVIDESGAAVPGAMVTLSSSNVALQVLPGMQPLVQSGYGAATDEQGEFSITLPSLPSVGSSGNLSLYEYKISAFIDERNDQSSVRSVTKKIELVPGQTVNVTLVLPNQTGVIKGRVTDPSGAPIKHTSVIARHHRYGVFQANTDANGVYEFGRSGDALTGTQFLPEGVYDLEFVGPGNPVQHGALYQVKTGTLNADVVLTSKVWRVTGGVIDADSREPLHQFGIYIEYAPLADRAQPYFKTINLNSYDGTYEVPFFETGRYRLRFYADGYEPQAGLITVVEDSNEVQPLNVELRKSETTGSIQGIFVSTSGSQLGRVEVAGIGVFPAQNNQFLIENLPPGQHDLVFYLFETASQSYIPIGVLTSVTVQAGGRTQIGPVTAANLQTRYAAN